MLFGFPWKGRDLASLGSSKPGEVGSGNDGGKKCYGTRHAPMDGRCERSGVTFGDVCIRCDKFILKNMLRSRRGGWSAVGEGRMDTTTTPELSDIDSQRMMVAALEHTPGACTAGFVQNVFGITGVYHRNT